MCSRRGIALAVVLMIGVLGAGCAAPTIDFSEIERPGRAAELEAFNVFVGSWTWDAEMTNAEGPQKKWTGTATWHWTLDKRCLHGSLTSTSGDIKFDSAGIWSWHPKSKKYIWWMFNNWGYPQEGSAKYDEGSKTWTMSYTSVGLDGTASYGRYQMKIVNNDTLDWSLEEWADVLHMFPKMAMKGMYKRTG